MSERIAGVASEVVVGLKGQPVILGLIVLNLIGMGGAVWFLRTLSVAQSNRIDKILQACLPGARP